MPDEAIVSGFVSDLSEEPNCTRVRGGAGVRVLELHADGPAACTSSHGPHCTAGGKMCQNFPTQQTGLQRAVTDRACQGAPGAQNLVSGELEDDISYIHSCDGP